MMRGKGSRQRFARAAATQFQPEVVAATTFGRDEAGVWHHHHLFVERGPEALWNAGAVMDANMLKGLMILNQADVPELEDEGPSPVPYPVEAFADTYFGRDSRGVWMVRHGFGFSNGTAKFDGGPVSDPALIEFLEDRQRAFMLSV